MGVLLAAALLAAPLPVQAQDAGVPAVPPADAEPPSVVQAVEEGAAEAVRLTKDAFANYTITMGWSIKWTNLRQDNSANKGDSPSFLPEGNTGKDIFTGRRTGEAQSVWFNLAGPVTFFEGSDLYGSSYNIGYFTTRFDKYEPAFKGYDVTHTDGGLTGTFLYAVPAFVAAGSSSDGPDKARVVSTFGLGIMAVRFDGTLHARRSTVFKGEFANETYRGSGDWNYSPVVSIESTSIFYRHLAVSWGYMIAQSGGLAYSEFSLRLGYAFSL